MRSGKSYILRATPYRTSEHKIDGAVITLYRHASDAARGRTRRGKRVRVLRASSWWCSTRTCESRPRRPRFIGPFRSGPETVQNRPLPPGPCPLRSSRAPRRSAQGATDGAAIAPFTVEFNMDGDAGRKFECRLRAHRARWRRRGDRALPACVIRTAEKRANERVNLILIPRLRGR